MIFKHNVFRSTTICMKTNLKYRYIEINEYKFQRMSQTCVVIGYANSQCRRTITSRSKDQKNSQSNVQTHLNMDKLY